MPGTLSAVPRPAGSRASFVGPLLIGALFLIAAWFVGIYVLHYYLHYEPHAYKAFWPQPRRSVLLLHITCGTVALLTGPWQFSTSLRQRSLQLHRVVGRVYLISVALGSLAAFALAATTPVGWPWGFGLAMLGVAWLTTSSMAYYAIRRRQIEQHKQWMVRSYVVTFAFVTFRILVDVGPWSHLKPRGDLFVTAIWACWAIPLLFTEAILGFRRMRARSLAH